MKIANLAEATKLLNGFIPRPLDVRQVYNLDTIRKLVAFLGNPQDTLRVIHVAGTSGKTSTSYYAAALLHAAGKKVGLTVSPHITAMNERLQINLVPLSEAEFCSELGIFIDEVHRSGLSPTYFELLMAFAYWEFARQRVDYAIVEVGLGGLLDGSNVVTRADKVCVIADIGLDHMGVLGSTLPEIAAQKAGIIHDRNVVFMHDQPAEIMEVVRQTVQAHKADLRVASAAANPELAALPRYQRRNITLAMAVADYALKRDGGTSLTPTMIAKAAATHIPGRMETFRSGDKVIILDGAHNPQKLQAMIDSVRAEYPEQRIAALVGFVGSKEVSLAENVELLAGLARHVIVTGFGATQENGQTSIDPHMVAGAMRLAGVPDVTEIADHAEALHILWHSPEPVLLVTGSLYLISYLRPLILASLASR